MIPAGLCQTWITPAHVWPIGPYGVGPATRRALVHDHLFGPRPRPDMGTMTPVAIHAHQTAAVVVAERVTSTPFRVVVDVDPAVYDDPTFLLTIALTTLDLATGQTRGAVSTHTGTPRGKSGQWALGYKQLPPGLKTTIAVAANKPCNFGLIIEENDRASRPTFSAIAFDEFDYAETSSSASTLAVTGVTVDTGDFLLALASVFNSSGSTMAVSDPTNGTWTVPAGSPVLPDANSQGHIQYFTNAAALSAASVTFDPTGTSSDIDAVVIEISGAAVAGFDQYVENTGTYTDSVGATATVTTATLAQANNLAFTVTTHNGTTVGFTEHAAYTLVAEDTDNATSQALHTQRLTTATAATTALTATVAIAAGTGSDVRTWGIAIIVVKELVAAGGDHPAVKRMGGVQYAHRLGQGVW